MPAWEPWIALLPRAAIPSTLWGGTCDRWHSTTSKRLWPWWRPADAAQAEAGQLRPRTPPSDAQLEASREGHARFVQRDGPGAWVAVSEGQAVGVAESVRRERFWGLSMLFVHPAFQSRGVGGRLLEAAMGYAADATQRMIQSSSDPYFLAGLAHALDGRDGRRTRPPGHPTLVARSGW